MPPDTDHDQELSLKKRARRRLARFFKLNS